MLTGQRDPQSPERPNGGTLLFIELDGCKPVNEVTGYETGDTLIFEVARRLLAVAGPDHVVARVSGNAFAILPRGLDPDAVAAFSQRLRDAIDAPLVIAGAVCRISASIEVRMDDRSGGMDLIEAAAQAKNVAKATVEADPGVERQRQKMEALGHMVAGAAHEINNMIQPVLLLSQDLLDSQMVTDEGRRHVDGVLECIGKARLIIGDLLRFSRPSQRHEAAHDPLALVPESLRLVRHAIPRSVKLAVSVEGKPPPIEIDRSAFTEIMFHLVSNAVTAMEGRGEVTIYVDKPVSSAEDGSDALLNKVVSFARLRISDTGRGLDRESPDPAFELFSQPGRFGAGIGLGLQTVYEIVHEVGGMMTVEGDSERGTTATIVFPGRIQEAD